MDQAAWRSITFGNFASGDQPPQLNEQFSREGDNHRRLAYTLCALGPRLVPLSERAILLEHNKPPSELDHSAADPGVACLGEPLLPPLAAALVGRAGKTGIARDGSSISHVSREDLIHYHISRFNADTSDTL